MINDANIDYGERLAEVQGQLDGEKSKQERNAMGQFATPYALAKDIAKVARTYFTSDDVSFLEPSMGIGAFYAAFIEAFGNKDQRAAGFEIDPHYALPAKELWTGKPIEITIGDFLSQAAPEQKYDCILANPPYVRHHHIEQGRKAELQRQASEICGENVSGLTGLYCYFMMLSGKWLAEDGISCWLVPTEFMDVNYGQAVKAYLTSQVELLRIHRFEASDTRFDDALVSSCVVIFRKRKPSINHTVELTWGEDIKVPRHTKVMATASMQKERKWTGLFAESESATSTHRHTIGDFFVARRGLVTGDNSFFILDDEAANRHGINSEFLFPIVPSPRYLEQGIESIGAQTGLNLFCCNMGMEALRKEYPSVAKYVEKGEASGCASGYICSKRTPWYHCPR